MKIKKKYKLIYQCIKQVESVLLSTMSNLTNFKKFQLNISMEQMLTTKLLVDKARKWLGINTLLL